MAVKKKSAKKKVTAKPGKVASPKVGSMIDKLWLQDQQIHKVEQMLQKEKAKRDEIQLELLDGMRKNELHGARGKLATAFVAETKHPKIVSHHKFWKFIVSNRAYDLVQNRVASKAYYDRRADGQKVPGVKTFVKTRVSVRKAK